METLSACHQLTVRLAHGKAWTLLRDSVSGRARIELEGARAWQGRRLTETPALAELEVMALRPCGDDFERVWIAAARRSDRTPITVSHLIPRGYAAYAQVLHAIHVLPGAGSLAQVFSRDAVSSARDELAQELIRRGAKMPAGAAISRARIGGTIRERKGTRILWREVTAFFGAALPAPAGFDRDLWNLWPGDWPDQLDGPAEGSLTLSECRALVRALSPFTSTDVTYWYPWANTEGWTGRCDTGALSDLLEYFNMDTVAGSPEYWWPNDRGWIVHTDIDCSYSLIGGSRALVDALLEDTDLECVEVSADSVLGTDY